MKYVFYELNKDYKKSIIKNFLFNGLIKIKDEFLLSLNISELQKEQINFYLVVEKKYFKLIKFITKDLNINLITDSDFNNLKISDFDLNEDDSFYLIKDNYLIKDSSLIYKWENKANSGSFVYKNKSVINFFKSSIFNQELKIVSCFKKKSKKISLPINSLRYISNLEDLSKIDDRYLNFEKEIVFTPGPVSILPSTKNILGFGNAHHRTEIGTMLIRECVLNTKKAFCSKKGTPLIFVSSGTGALDSAFTNLVDSNTKVLIINTGFFGQLLVNMAKSYSIDYVELKCENGQTYNLEDVKKYVGQVDIIFVTYLETSSGVVNNIEDLGKLCKNTKTLVVTDSISATINEKLLFDKWGIDFAVASSTKGFETSPGIAVAIASKKAIDRSLSINKKQEFYYDWSRYIAKNPMTGGLPSTSPINIINAMNESWRYIESHGGLTKIQQEKKRKWNYLFKKLSSMGFENFVKNKNNQSNWLLTVTTPKGVSASFLKMILYVVYGLLIECGIMDETDSILRIAISMNTSIKDIDLLTKTIKQLINKISI